MRNTFQIIQTVHLRTPSWTFAQAEVAVHQLLENLGLSIKDTASHDTETATAVAEQAMQAWAASDE